MVQLVKQVSGGRCYYFDYLSYFVIQVIIQYWVQLLLLLSSSARMALFDYYIIITQLSDIILY